jgi:hypothetical protein
MAGLCNRCSRLLDETGTLEERYQQAARRRDRRDLCNIAEQLSNAYARMRECRCLHKSVQPADDVGPLARLFSL